MALAQTMAPQHEVKLQPVLKKRLLTKLRMYEELTAQRKAIDAAMAKTRGEIDSLRDETGEKSLALEGFRMTLVEPIKSKLDKKKLLIQGVTLAEIEAATTTKPGKAYLKITLPGESEESDTND